MKRATVIIALLIVLALGLLAVGTALAQTPPPTPMPSPPGCTIKTSFSVSYQLQGSVQDDGIHFPAAKTAWSQIGGPANSSFDDASLLAPTVTLTEPGVYTFMLEADDGQYRVYDQVVITVEAASNQPPCVDAGPDKSILLIVAGLVRP